MKRIDESTKLFAEIIRTHEFNKILLKTNNLLFVFFILIFFSCTRYNEEATVIKGMIQDSEINFQKDRKYVVMIVPATGCSSCAEPSKEFIKQINNPKFIIIGSCYSSRDFRMSFSEDDLENKNYIIDSEGQSFHYGLINNGARLYFFENGKIVDIKIISCAEPNLLTHTLDFIR